MAHAGSGAAFYNLGQAYRQGQGIRVSVGEAIGFFAQGGLQKHVESLSGLATLLYFEVQGRVQIGEALALWREAGRGRSAEAQYMLAVLHYNGQGVPQDIQLAYAWSHLAAEKGFKAASDIETRSKARLTAHAVAQADLLMTALEGEADFDGLQVILQKWASQAPQLAPRKAIEPARTLVRPAVARRPAVNPARKNWRLQVGAFSSIGGAQLQLQRMANGTEDLLKGLRWTLLQNKRKGGDEMLYRLQIGPFPDRTSAEAKCDQIKPLDLDCFVVAP